MRDLTPTFLPMLWGFLTPGQLQAISKLSVIVEIGVLVGVQMLSVMGLLPYPWSSSPCGRG